MTINQEGNNPTGQDVLALLKRVERINRKRLPAAESSQLDSFVFKARAYQHAHGRKYKYKEKEHLRAAIPLYPDVLAVVEQCEAVARAARAARAAQKAAAQSAAQVPESRAATNNPADTVEGPTDGSGADSSDGPPSGRPRVPIEALPPGVSVRMVDIGDIVIPPNRKLVPGSFAISCSQSRPSDCCTPLPSRTRANS